MNDDEPTDAVLSVAVVAQHVLTMAEALVPIHGPEAVRDAMLVAYVTLAERALGRDAMLAELHGKIATLTEHPAIMDAVIKWLH